jgi:hypothetical protein
MELILNSSSSNEGFLGVMLSILSSEKEAEIMREKSIHVLRKTFQPILDDFSSRTTEVEYQIVINFFVSYSNVILERFHVPRPCLPQNEHFTRVTPASGYRAHPEPVEEIRLLLMKLLSDILSYFQAYKNKNPNDCRLSDNTDTTDAFNNICQILPLQYALLGPYPELKRECCLVLKQLCNVAPSSVIQNHLDSLLQPLTFPLSLKDGDAATKACLLQHRHSKTRVCAIEATDAIIMLQLTGHLVNLEAGGETSPDNGQLNAIHGILESRILPSWKQCVLDRSALVRKTIIESLGKVAIAVMKLKSKEEEEYRGSILSPKLWQLLFSSLVDEATDNRILAKEVLERISLESSYFWSSSGHLNALALHALPHILPLNLEDASNWSAPRRLQAIRSIDSAFSVMLTADEPLLNFSPIVVSEGWINSIPLNNILTMLCSLIEDEESSIIQAAASCAKTLGKHPIIGSSVTFRLLSSLRGNLTVSNGVDGTIPALLNVLNNVVCSGDYASSQRWVETLVQEICSVLAGSYILQNFTDVETMCQLTNICETILEVTHHTLSDFLTSKIIEFDVSSACGDPLIYFMRCCIQILGCPDSFGLSSRSLAMIDRVSKACRNCGHCANILWESSFRMLVNILLAEEYDANVGETTSGIPQSVLPHYWDKSCPQFAAFEALLLHCDRDSLARNIDLVASIFSRHLAPPPPGASFKEDATSAQVANLSTRLSFMALLQSVISKISLDMAQLRSLTSSLVENIIAPNLVWQVGGPASALRKVSIACLYTLLRGGGVAAQLTQSSLVKIFPVIMSNLGDDDASIRHLTCLCLTMLIKDSQVISEGDYLDRVSTDLVKALDDSNENIRLVACDAILILLKHAPEIYFIKEGTRSAITNIVEHVMVHMDDSSNYELQLKCLDVLTAALDIDSAVVIKCTKETPRYQSKSNMFYEEISRRANKKIAIGDNDLQ